MGTSILAGIQITSGTLMRGLLVGITYGLLAVGLVLIYRSSRVLNFAHAEIGIFAAIMFEKLVKDNGISYWIALPLALWFAAQVGALCEVVIIRRLRKAPKVMSVVATLGLSVALLAGGALLRGGNTTSRMPMPPGLPEFKVGTFTVNPAWTGVLIFGPLSVAALALFLKRSRVGLTIRGSAANPDAARMAGVSPGKASSVAWGLAGSFSALSAIFIAAALGSASGSASGAPLLVRAVAAAVVARFLSFPIAFVAGTALGVIEQVVSFNVPQSGQVELVVLAVIVVGVLAQRRETGSREREAGNWLALAAWDPIPRSLRRSPLVRFGGLGIALVGVLGALGFGLLGPSNLTSTLQFVLVTAGVGLSVYVLTGLCGQLSLGQYAVSGVGAIVCARTASALGGELSVSLLIGGLAGAVCSMLICAPALRLRGLFVALSTLGFALMASEWLFQQTWMAGSGYSVPEMSLFGYELRTTKAEFVVILGVFCLLLALVRNAATSGVGAKLRALRDNEDQARGFSIAAARTKLFGFGLAGFVAGVAGGLGTLTAASISAQNFPTAASFKVVAAAALGGLGSLAGPIVGALYIEGLPAWLPLKDLVNTATSFGWLVLILYAPSGILSLLRPVQNFIVRKIGAATSSESAVSSSTVGDSGLIFGSLLSNATIASAKGPLVASVGASAADSVGVHSNSAAQAGVPLLSVRGLTKRYGGVTAVNSVDLEVRKGETLGLIGANGAGKTTLFEMIGGFNGVDAGTVFFEGRDVTTMAPEDRSRIGLVRSFQDAPLFPTMTVRETVALALERRFPTKSLAALLGLRRNDRFRSAKADELLDITGLTRFADTPVSALSTGTRRIAELACIVALEPSLLLLDEPSSGIAQRESEALAGVLRAVKERLGTTVVIIEHDMPLIRALSDRLVAMEAGEVIAEGSPASVLANERVIASYLGGDVTAIERSGVTSDAIAAANVATMIPDPGTEVAGIIRRPLPTVTAKKAAKKRAVMLANRRLGWVTLPMLIVSTLLAYLDDRVSIAAWLVTYSSIIFTVMFLVHGFLSVYLFGFPRPARVLRVVHIYIGYAVLVFTLAAQGVIGTEPLHTILLVPMWTMIGAHVALGFRFAWRRRQRVSAEPELPLYLGGALVRDEVADTLGMTGSIGVTGTTGGAGRASTGSTESSTGSSIGILGRPKRTLTAPVPAKANTKANANAMASTRVVEPGQPRGRGTSGSRIPASATALRSGAPGGEGVSLSPITIPPMLLALLAAVGVGLGVVLTQGSVIKHGPGLLPAAFVAVIGAHAVVGWQLVSLYRQHKAKVGYVLFAFPVLAGMVYDCVMLGIGNAMGHSSLLLALNRPRFWLHALFTPFMVFFAVGVGRACGIPWVISRTRWWTALGAVLILGGSVIDIVLQHLKPEDTGDVIRYANDAVIGPPVNAIVTVAVVLAVGYGMWNRGYRASMFQLGLATLVGAAAGAQVPLLGNAAEVLFMVAALAGARSALAGPYRRSNVKAPAGLIVRWPINVPLVASVFSIALYMFALFGGSDVAETGNQLIAPLFLLYAVMLVLVGVALVRFGGTDGLRRGVGGFGVMRSGSKKKFSVSESKGQYLRPLYLVLSALIYDNVVLAFGNILGQGSRLQAWSRPRFWGHTLFVPLVIVVVADMAIRCGVLGAKRRRRWVWIAAGLVAYGVYFDFVGRNLEFKDSGGVQRYNFAGFGGPPIPVVVTMVFVLIMAFKIWRAGYSPLMLGCSVAMLVGAALGSQLPMVANLVVVVFMVGLAAGHQAVLGHRPLSMLTPTRTPLAVVAGVGRAGAKARNPRRAQVA
jgi:ABC-type branched-subunit amino acid transport system ATPase component/branched-subunit amino acid ABC-type transport system permease component